MDEKEVVSNTAGSEKQTNTTGAPKVQTDTRASGVFATTNHAELERVKKALSSPVPSQLSKQPVVSNPSGTPGTAPKLDVPEVGFGESAASKFNATTAARFGVSTSTNFSGSTNGIFGGSITNNKTDVGFRPFTLADMHIKDARSNSMTTMPSDPSDLVPSEVVKSKPDLPIPRAVLKIPAAFRIPKSKAIDFGLTVVTFHIGVSDPGTTFTVHENILRARSAYWEAIFSKYDQKIHTLDDVDAKTFGLYIQLIYTGRIPSKPALGGVHDDTEYGHLCKLYVFTYKYKDLEAQNIVVDALCAKSQEADLFGKDATQKVRDASLPSRQCVELMYKSTGEGSGARRLLIDLYACTGHGQWMRNEKEPFPSDFMTDLALSLLETRMLSHSRVMKTPESYHDVAEAKKE